MHRIAIKPNWIVSMAGDPVRDYWLVASGGRIEFIGPSIPHTMDVSCRLELNDVAILPGLINSHCHTEFSDLTDPIRADSSFTKWIENVVAYRATNQDLGIESRKRAITTSIQESLATGTRFLIDTMTAPWSAEWVEDAIAGSLVQSEISIALTGGTPFLYLACPEVLDIRRDRKDATLSHAQKVTQSVLGKQWGSSLTALSPHAPYTTSLRQVQETVDMLIQRGGVVSMHLAESLDEMEWLRDQSGPMREALSRFRDPEYLSNLGSIQEYVREVVNAPRALVAHGNYLPQSELDLLRTKNSSAAIVHCPRTYEHFHPNITYPLAERLSMGVTHLIGTDSRASNPDLNLWAEVQTIAVRHAIPASEMIAMVTKGPALLLGVSDMGTLEVGKRSLCTAILVPGFKRLHQEDLLDRLVKSDTIAVPLERMLLDRAIGT